jgi:hypothetical protein
LFGSRIANNSANVGTVQYRERAKFVGKIETATTSNDTRSKKTTLLTADPAIQPVPINANDLRA